MTAETYVYSGLALLFGLVIGSFLNVVIYRVPAKKSILGRSGCPKCGNQIKWFDNIPVLSWLALGAKCRNCKEPISARYPIVEAATGLIWFFLTLTFYPTNPELVPLLLVASAASVALFMIDLDTMTLPNVITYPLFIFTAGYLTVLAAMQNHFDLLMNAGIGAGIYFGFFFLLWFLTGGRGLGFGDVKLAPTLGALIGWFSIPATVAGIGAAFIIGGLPAGLAMALGWIKKGTAIPFGPMLLIGAWTAIIWGQQIVDMYLSLF